MKNREYITVSEDGYLHLTDEGRRIAESVYERHTLLTEWLIHLGVDPKVAASDACKMEHDITPESYEAMKNCILSILGRDERRRFLWRTTRYAAYIGRNRRGKHYQKNQWEAGSQDTSGEPGAIGTFRHRNRISGVLLRSVRYRGENRDTEQYQDRLTPVNPHLRHKNTIRKAAQPQCLQGIEPLNKERRRPDLNR